MLYDERNKPFSRALFEKPTAGYRGAPFWAWNCELKQEELLWQLERFREMGFGGFFMHARTGLRTPYLGPEFTDCVKACAARAGKLGLRACLYDEDRYPSGFAGGLVTAEPRFRQKMLLFTLTPPENVVDPETGCRTGQPYYLCSFDIVLSEDGRLASYRQIGPRETAVGAHWQVYVKTAELSPRYNGACYVDTMNPEAVDAFLKITYEHYRDALGPLFGTAAPEIFTDEPQLRYSGPLKSSFSTEDAVLSWTTDFAESFREAYGYELIPHLPEILWELPEGQYSRARYHYRDHVCERFTRAYCDRIGAWCAQNGIAFTGHIISEDRLEIQTNQTGECMRCYRAFTLPGIDVLCDEYLPTTAKQCQSAVHQYGREGMSSELYGVTGWDFDFTGHKLQGDWQAALGVTQRVPHLAWASMKGRAKRDFPGSIGYQAAWYREYPLVEDHFARLNTVLTRGVPVVNLAVLHPIESFWLAQGPADVSGTCCDAMEERFASLTDWLLNGTLDFDFFAESLLPSLCRESADARFTLGAMAYRAVLIPPVLTLRLSTVRALESFLDRGGRVFVCAGAPLLVDAVKSEAAERLWTRCSRIDFTEEAVLAAAEELRELGLSLEDGTRPRDFLYTLREEKNGFRWLFLARRRSPDRAAKRLTLRLRGLFRPYRCSSENGQISPLPFRAENGFTELCYELNEADSLLLGLEKCEAGSFRLPPSETKAPPAAELLRFEHLPYRLEEPNVLVLDQPLYSLDGLHYRGPEELRRIDAALRGVPEGSAAQPWTDTAVLPLRPVRLRFSFESEGPFDVSLAFEEALEIRLNGQEVPLAPDGWFVDRSLSVQALPPLRKGRNYLELTVPFSRLHSLENCFLQGRFAVRLRGRSAGLFRPEPQLHASDLCAQGLPFYGGAIRYELAFDCRGEQYAAVRTPAFAGAVIALRLDGREAGHIAYAPYRQELGLLGDGPHRLELTLFLSRENCFGALHERVPHLWKNYRIYYTEGDEWSYSYQLKPAGLLAPPEIELKERS